MRTVRAPAETGVRMDGRARRSRVRRTECAVPAEYGSTLTYDPVHCYKSGCDVVAHEMATVR
jgi:hypothetical protein